MIQTRPDIPNRLWQLFEAVCQEDHSAIDAEELKALLIGHPDRQQAYLDYCRLHTQLYFLVNAKQATERVRVELLGGSPVSVYRPAPRVSIGGVFGLLGRRIEALGKPAFWSVLAAGLLFAGYFAAISWNLLDKELPSGTDGNQIKVAAITGSQDASWAKQPRAGLPAAIAANESSIAEGEPLAIDSGLVELQLNQGVRLLIEGPAEWFIEGNNEAVLKRGKLVATVPGRAVGFTIRTPSAQVVDLGTEFGVEVLSDGTSRVDVFRGKVQVHTAGKPGGNSASRLLRASESTTISPTSSARSQLSIQTAEPDRFRRQIPPADPQWSKLPVQSYHYSSSIGPNLEEYRNDPACRKLIDGAGGSFAHKDGAWVGFQDPSGLQPDADPGIPPSDNKQPQPAICFVLERPARSLRLGAVQIKYLIDEQYAIRAPSLVRIRTAESEAALQSALWTEFTSLDDEPAVKGLNAGTVKRATLPLPEVHGPHIEIEFYNRHEWTYLSEISFLQAKTKEGSH